MTSPWLIVIDMQDVFARADSEWHVSDFASIAESAAALTAKFGRRAVATKFVAPGEPSGSWVDYYERWPAQLCESSASDWDLTIPITQDTHVVTETTFNKWKESLQAIVPDDAPLIICGVSTECCVLATAVAAADVVATSASLAMCVPEQRRHFTTLLCRCSSLTLR